MDGLSTKNITIVEANNDGTKVKIKDENNLSYTFFINKQDGSESKAYEFWRTLNANGKGTSVSIAYKETQGEYQGNPVTYRNIMAMKYGAAQSVSRTVAQVKQHEVNKDAEQEKWDKIAIGKVRHGFAIEAFKLGLKLDQFTAEIIDSWTDYVMSGELKAKPTPAENMRTAMQAVRDIPTININDFGDDAGSITDEPPF